jgi:outer membrane protein assembly complex protein YaeT
MEVEWTSLTATVGDVSISIPVEGAPPLTASIASGRVKLAWSGLTGLAGGQVHITSIEAKGAAFSCSREWIDRWRPRSAAGRKHAVEIRVDKLEVEDGTAEYLDLGQRVAIHASQLALSGDWSTSRRLLIGSTAFQATVEAPPFARPWGGAVRGGVRIGSGRVEIFSATAHGPGADAELSGTVTWGAGASFTSDGRASLEFAALEPYLVGHAGLSGHAEGPVQIVFSGGAPVRVTAQVKTTDFRVGPVRTDSATADITVRPHGLEVAALRARAYGGEFTGAVSLAFGKPLRLTTDLVGRGVDLGRLTALTGRELPIASSAGLTFRVEGDPAHLAGWSGEGTFDAVPAAGGKARVPARGRGRLIFGDGAVRVVADRLEVGEATFRFDLKAGLEVKPVPLRLTVDGTTRDAAATQRATLLVLDALDLPRNRFANEPISGNGTVRADLRTGETTQFDLDLDLQDGTWSRNGFEHALLDLGVDPAGVTIRRLAASRGSETVRGSAQFSGADASLLSIDIHARDLRLGTALTAVLGTAPADGRLDLDLKGTRLDGILAATGALTGRGIIVGHEIADWVTTPVRVEGNLVVLEDIEVFGQAVGARGRAVYDLGTREGSIDLDPLTLELAASRTLADSGASARGRVEARGTIALLPDGPHGSIVLAASDARIEVQRNGLRELELGDLTGSADLTPQGAAISVRAVPASAWTFEAFLGFKPTLPISAVLYFEDLLLGAGSTLGQSADLRLKGQIQAEGELTRPSDLEINGAIDDAALRLGSRVLRSAAPFPLRLDAGRFVLGPSRLEGDGARLELGANGSLDGACGGRLAGTLDLGVVSALWSDLRGSGGIDFDIALSGTIAAPSLQGRAGIHDGRLRILGYRQTLEQIDAEASISGETLTLTSFRALLGGGEVSATGRLTFDGLRPAGYHAEFSASNVAATYPEGFSGVYEGHLDVDGSRKGAAISGRIRVVRGLYTKDFDLNVVGGPRREFEGAEESAIPRGITLSVDVVSDGNIMLRNDVAKLEALGEIHVGGELARPEVTGRLSLVSGGSVRYRDVDYRLDYGTLDLTDRRKINPYVDIRGHTRVAEYEITLRVEGTMDHFDYELTSAPPLASQDIISLLVTGKTLDSISGSATAGALPADMAAYYFAGLLSSTFGKQIQHSLGIDQLEVTPLLLKGQTDPTARVTIGKRVSDDVKIVFSQDIGTAQKQTYQVVWDATRRVRVLVESDTETGLGGEIQYSRQFGGAHPAAVGKAVIPALAGVDLPGTLRTVRVIDDSGLPRPDLAKAAKLPPGRPFERGGMLAAGERIRLALVKAGRLQAGVRSEATRDPGDGSYDVVYKVAPGPKTTVELITPSRRGTKAMRRSLAAFWRESAYTIDYWDQAAHALLVQLQRDGYYTADVTWEQVVASDGNVLRFHIDRGKPVRLRAVRFHGASALPRSRIDAQMASLQSTGLKKRLLRPEVLAADLAAVRALYRDEGYARVRMGAPVITLTASGEAAEVDVTIEEGPRFLVREIAFPADAPVGGEAMAGWVPLKKGGVFAPRLLAESEQALRDHLDELGYPDVEVESRVTLDANSADVAFDVAAGGKKHVATIAIEGNRVTKSRTISKALTFGVRDVVSRDDLLKSQQQLYRTALFSSVRMTYAAVDEGDPSAQRVTVRVEEAPPLSFGLGVGYDSDDGPRASFLVGYSNLGGRNVGIAVQGLVSANQQRGQVTFRRRQLFGRATDSLLSLLYEKTVETGFSQKRNSVAIRFEQRPKPRWIRFVRYRLQQVNVFDITDPQATLDQIFEDHLSDIRLADIGVGLVRDTRDDAFAPTRGGYGSIEGSVFSRLIGSQADFAKLFLRGSVTITMKRGLRFASFLRIGAEQPFGGTEVVPLSERFFAGGSNTLRGFATDSVGGQRIPICLDTPAPTPPAPCVNEQSFNAGGEGLLILNEELLFPLWKALKGELFLDAGNVYPTLADFDPTDLRSAAGLGLRFDTPIGPIRVEYGWKLDRKDGESAGEFVIAIGAVF